MLKSGGRRELAVARMIARAVGAPLNVLLGREPMVDLLWQHGLAGHTVLVYGPVGIGKTSILDAIAERAVKADRPCGRSAHTEALADVTAALEHAYGSLDGELTQRQLRGRLRLSVERQPGLLLLDDLRMAGGALKGYLRSLRGKGLGVILAGDVEHPRDHRRLRDLGLSYRELEISGLPARHLAKILSDSALARPLFLEDCAAVLRAAHGRPGWIRDAAARLGDERYWVDGRIRLELLRADITMAKMAVALLQQ